MAKKKQSKKKKSFSKKDKKVLTDAFHKHFLGELAGCPVYSSDNFRFEKPSVKKYTDDDLLEVAKEQRQKIFTILNYILNKNSRPLSEGGVNYEKIFDEVQDLENYLLSDI